MISAGDGSIWDDAVWHKNGRGESEVQGSISEEVSLSSLDDIPDCDVKEYDPRV